MDRKNDIRRIIECLQCEYYEYCCVHISDPQDNPDGTCLTKKILSMRNDDYDTSRTS